MTQLAMPQRELAQQLRDAVDDLQASVTAREWGKAARRVRRLLAGNPITWQSAFVQYNIGERREYLQRFAIEQGIVS